MMALSIRQPWAWLIIAGFKDIENRSWATSHRGEVLIHAGREIDRDAHDALVAGRHPVTGEPSKLGLLYPQARIETGGIVGLVEITACVTASVSPWFVGRHGFVLARPRLLRFQPCRGQLGLFTPDRPIDLRIDEPIGEGRLL